MKENKLSNIFTWFLIWSVFLLPVFFVPYLINPFLNSKLALTFLIAFVSIFTFIIKGSQIKKWQFIKTPLTLPLLAFAIFVIVSIFINHQYPNRQLLGTGGILLSFMAIILIAPSILNKTKLNKQFTLAVNWGAVLLGVLSILQFFGYGLPAFIVQISAWKLNNDLSFSLTGTAFVTIQLLSVIILSNVLDQISWKDSWFNKIATIIAAVALGINIWAVLPGGQASFQNLSLTASTTIAKNSLILTKNALFGYGPDSYDNAFNILKPIWFNGLDYWQANFNSAFNLPLTLVVSTGIIGLLIYLLFLWKTFTTVKKADEQNTFLKIFILSAVIWQFFSPMNPIMFILLAIALAFFIASHSSQYKKASFSVYSFADLVDSNALNNDRAKLTKIKNSVLLGGNIIFIAFFGFLFYVTAKSFVAYNLVYQSQINIDKNDAVKAYENYGQAKNLVPKLDFIRRSNALINLDIAIAMSNKTDITPAEQAQVLRLVNQSINEAKAATILNPLNYQNWYVLSQIYMQLLGTTDQAQQEAFNALAKAITYNPSNPELRILMGQLFLNSKDYTNAVTFFNQALERKTDLPAAHYYLAQALEASEQWVEAQTALKNTLALLEKDSEDYKTVEKELAIVNARVEAAAQKTTDASAVVKQQPEQNSNLASSVLEDTMIGSTSSNLSTLLDQQETETAIQESALTPDQSLVEN